jgi:D-alanyl-D-alanine carboxypeptidase
MKLEDLLYGAYISSANDACHIVAEYLAGDVAAFVDRMNARALQLGCAGTRFASPGGQGDPEQYTTPWDEYLIFKTAVDHPLFLKISGVTAYETAPTDFAYARMLINGNLMLDMDSAYHYDTYISGCLDTSGESGARLSPMPKTGSCPLISVLSGSIEARICRAEQSFLKQSGWLTGI